jgi:hypothetical protein
VSIWLVLLFGAPFGFYSTLPALALEGYGIGRPILEHELIRSLALNPSFLEASRWSTLVFCTVAILMPGRRWPLVLVFVQVLALEAITKSIGGYVNHAQFLPMYSLAVIALFGQVKCLSLPQCIRDGVRAWHQRNEMTLTERTAVSVTGTSHDERRRAMSVLWLISLGFIIPYTFVGLNRFVEGGLTVPAHENWTAR